ncbi:MAG TPA: tetratricopeptide repeat protein [Candidatus Eremiobacteraceae bacterium]|nr:tetratricopeptide repeat protein [Candidatus Eremiobacteraceae bacterium]
MLHLGPGVNFLWPAPAKWPPVLLLGLCALLPAFAGRFPQPAKAANSSERQVTFNRDIAPIIFHSCSSCHRPGEAAPFSLLTYEDVKKHARQIAEVTRTRNMPPWLPAPQELKFADEMRLPDAQIVLIQRWVDGGAVEGATLDLPSQPKFVEGWQLGTPDLILTAEKPLVLPPQGTDTYWNFIFPIPIRETRWVRAIEIRPGDKRYVHHANILVDRAGSLRNREVAPGAGFGGMEIRIESQVFDPDSHLLFWKPGTVPYVEPEGMALRLDKGTDLILNTHLQPSGKPEVIQPSIGLYFTSKPATKLPMLLQLENDAKLDIPAGEKNFEVTDEFTLPIDVDLLAIYPHAHYLGKEIQAFATLPDGTRETLIHIPRWNLSWQAVYRYEQPALLPKGTAVTLRYVYDNSEENPLNPNQPPVRVRAGNRSNDEMCHLWLQVLPVNYAAQGDPRMVLQQALARHNVEKNPGDFEAHYNLAAMLQARGELDNATREYATALRLRPDDAVANNAMGTALLARGRADEASPYLRAALKTRPDYFDAHYNLGNLLALRGDFEGASQQFSLALRTQPDDANAEANLGSALAEMGKFAEAKSHLERALQIDPNHSLAKENLEELQREMNQR